MKRIVTFASALALVGLSAAPVAAQDDLLNTCSTLQAQATPPPPGGVPAEITEQFRFFCGQIVNAVTNVQPSIGIGFTGGAHTLGTATTIGRRLGFFPRVSATAKFNLALADVPGIFGDFAATVSEGGEVSPMPTARLPVGSLQGDVVVGLFNGISLGPAMGGIGAVDLLGSVSFIPAVEQVQDAIGLEDDILNIGVGARVGLLRQGLLMPGISVSGMFRHMGTVTFGDLESPAPAAFSTDLSTLSLRLGASKGLLMFDVAAGAGYDIYSSNVDFNWDLTYNCPPSQCGTATDISLQPTEAVSGELKTAAWNVYANAGLSLLLLNLVGEVGYQKATDIISAADLQEAGLPDQEPTADELGGGRLFFAFGIRLTL